MSTVIICILLKDDWPACVAWTDFFYVLCPEKVLFLGESVPEPHLDHVDVVIVDHQVPALKPFYLRHSLLWINRAANPG